MIVTTNQLGVKMVKVRGQVLRIPELGDQLACNDLTTEVLTGNGWKFFPNLTPEDEVAILKDGEDT